MQKLDGKSLDIVSENVTKLKEIFPEVFSEGKIDFVKLEETLGDFAERDDERYNFTWKGKTEAKKVAQTLDIGFKVYKLDSSNIKEWDR